MLSTLLTGLLDLLAPPTCPGCSLAYTATPSETGFCDACEPLFEPAPGELRPPAAHAAAFLYQGPLADAIRSFKYAGQTDLQRYLAPLLVRSAGAYVGTVDAVVPVPLHPAKLRQRGWNPPALLARPVARMLGVPLRTSWLRRTRDTQAQAGLCREARAQNVRGAFHAAARTPARILLIDDVRTTGATLLEAASSLELRGHTVKTLTLAWSPHETSETNHAARRDHERPPV